MRKTFWFLSCKLFVGSKLREKQGSSLFLLPTGGGALGQIIYPNLSHVTRFLLLLWFDITQIETTSYRTNWDQKTDTHKYILTPPVTCTQQLPVLHWIDKLLMQKFTLDRSATFWKLHVEVIICWLDSTRLSPSCKTQRKRIEMV